MAKQRFEALKEVANRHYDVYNRPEGKISDYYGENVFGIEEMRAQLSAEVFERLINCIEKGEKIK